MTATKIHGACPHDCPDTCGLITEVENGRAVKFYASPDHPITEGWLCAKVRPYLDHVYHPDRLTHPLRRVGAKGDGEWRRISWEEALGEIGDRWRDIIGRYGAEAILPYSYSGTLGAVNMGVTSGRFWNRLGASQLERSICGAAAEMAVNHTLGVRQSQSYQDVAHSKLVIIWGHNPVSTAPHFMPQLRKAQKNGCKLVVIDPRRTRTAQSADLHIAPKPATDGALALGIAHVIVNAGLHDEVWLTANTIGWPELCARLAEYTPEYVAEITGISAEIIAELAELYATTQPALIKIADGLQRHPNGGQTVRCILTLPALTGQYGVRGGGLAYSTSGYLQWDDDAINKWAACPSPGRQVNMNRLGAALTGEVVEPPIQSLYIFGANPAAISPNAGLIRQGMMRDDLFTVVHELFMTDSAELADIVLPATSQLEQTDLHKAYGHTVLTYNQQAIAPLGESKSNWDVMRLLAAEMGYGEQWLRDSAETVIDELLIATARSIPGLQGITRDQLEREGSIQLPFTPDVPFADGCFPTPSGKVELRCDRLAAHGIDPLPVYVAANDDGGVNDQQQWHKRDSLNLISGAAHHFTTSTFANQAALVAREGEPFVEIHPDDAAFRRIEEGERVIVENGRGSAELIARVTDAVRPGVVASPKGRWAKFYGGHTINSTTPDALGDLAGQSTFHTNRVWIRKR